MKEIETKNKIVSLKEDFSEYELPDVRRLDFDLFVYSYQYESYEGSGFAAWKKGDKYFYHELGHCSCNGPTDGITTSCNAPVTFEDLIKVAEKSYGEHAKAVITYFKENVQN